MELLTVPNWSFGRNRTLSRLFREVLDARRVQVHYFKGDVDHNRTVTAFSGEAPEVRAALLGLCEYAFDGIDLNRHVGVHPRIGALDVCPIVVTNGDDLATALKFTDELAKEIAERFELPVFLYERSERGRHEADLPSLRRGGFGGLFSHPFKPDFGPDRPHKRLGATVMGVRDFLLAVNVNLDEPSGLVAKDLARRIRDWRREGDLRFLGVRALGLSLASRNLSQVSMNLTLPDITPVDPIIDWISIEAANVQAAVQETELVGVIREADLPGAHRLKVNPDQVVRVSALPK